MGTQRVWGPEGWKDVETSDVKASDAARAKATELGVDLADVEATGASGAITVADVEDAAEE